MDDGFFPNAGLGVGDEVVACHVLGRGRGVGMEEGAGDLAFEAVGLEVREGINEGCKAGEWGSEWLVGVRDVDVGVVCVTRLAHLGAQAFERGADVIVERWREGSAEVGGWGSRV